jgi:hypothetical protein
MEIFERPYHKSYVNIGPNLDPQYQIAYVYIENSITSSMVSETEAISQIIYIDSEGWGCLTVLFYIGACIG